MRENCWLPPEEKDDDSEPKTTQRSEKGSVDGVLKFLVDAVLSNASEGATFSSYLRYLARCRRNGIDVGDRNHNKEFMEIVEYMGAEAIKTLDANELHTKLRGIGVAFYFSIFFDAVSLGCTSFARHKTLMLVVGVGVVSPLIGCIRDWLLQNSLVILIQDCTDRKGWTKIWRATLRSLIAN